MRRITLSCLALPLILLGLTHIAEAQNVTITLTPHNPPIVIPATGGSFEFDMTLHNGEATPQTVDVWTVISGPVIRPGWGPYLGLTMSPSATITRTRTQAISDRYPAGAYTYTGYVGDYPGVIWDSDSFPFEKLDIPGGMELWASRYNGPGNGIDRACAVALDGLGNSYVTGKCVSYGSSDYATIKYDAGGNQLWVALYNGPGNSQDEAFALAVDGSGNALATGWSYGVGTNFDYATVKYDAGGHQTWVARYNGTGNAGDVAYALALDSIGNIYITGYSMGSGTGSDYTTVKYDAGGNQIWVARYNGTGNGGDTAHALALDDSGNVYATGVSDGYAGSGDNWDYATVKYDGAGNQMWVARYNGPGNGWDEAHALALDSSGNLYVTGFSAGSGADFDYATVKYDASGNQMWVARYNGSGNGDDQAFALARDDSGNVYVTGHSWGSGTSNDYATVKYDSAGNQIWAARYNGTGNVLDDASSLALDSDGNIYVTGRSVDGESYTDYTTVKYDAAGTQLWVVRYNGPGNWIDEATSIALDGSGNIYLTGKSYGGGTGMDYATVKYSGGNIANWMSVEATILGQPLPQEFALHQNYPNPFNASTVLSYQLPVAGSVSLKVYDTAGRLVETLVDGWRSAGTHELTFDATDLPSGIYFAKFEAGDYAAVQKLILLK